MIAVSKVEVKKDDGNGTYRRYVLTADGFNRPCFDITKELEAADREDKAAGFERETGRAFAFTIHQALKAMAFHEEIEARWFTANGREEDRPRIPFQGFWRTLTKDQAVVSKTWSW